MIVQGRNSDAPPEGGFASSVKPFSALLAGAQFLMNLEETHHFFTLYDAIDGKQNEINYQRYLASDTGAKLDRENINFADILIDKNYLMSFPAGSLAEAYLQFLSVENLDTELLMLAEQNANVTTLNLDQSRRNYFASGIALHDLMHVITGYGREPIGEACLLAFTAEQFSLKGVGVFAHALALREQVTHRKIPVMAMMKEARDRAVKAVWFPEIDWRDEFERPLNEVRSSIRVPPPKIYKPTVIETPPTQIDAGTNDQPQSLQKYGT